MSAGVNVLLIVVLLVLGSSISEYAQTLIQGRQQMLQRSAQLQSFASLRSDYNREAKNDLAVLERMLPIEEGLINLPKDIQVLASQDNLTYAFSFGGETPPSAQSFGLLQFQLTLGGPLERLTSFVGRLQNFKYLTKIAGIALTRNGANYDMALKGQVAFRAQ